MLDARVGLDRLDHIVVKFREGTLVRLRDARLTSLDASVDLGSVRTWLDAHPGVQVARHFSRTEEELDAAQQRGQRESGWALADLNLYYEFRLSPDARTASSLNSMLAEIRALPLIECAFAEPIPQPARAVAPTTTAPGQSASPLPSTRVTPPQSPPAPATPDYTGHAGLPGRLPLRRQRPGSLGLSRGARAAVKLVDIEGAWLWTHEDLPSPFFDGGTPIDDPSWRNHGTAVMGEMVGRNNAFGVTGIATRSAGWRRLHRRHERGRGDRHGRVERRSGRPLPDRAALRRPELQR